MNVLKMLSTCFTLKYFFYSKIPNFPKKNMAKVSKRFKDWTQYDLEQQFGLEKKSAKECAVLNDWLNVADSVEDLNVQTELDILVSDLSNFVDSWNEAELKIFFIAPLIRLVNFKSQKYKVFFERKLSASLNGIELKGDVDAMIASGSYSKIVAPFFCLQEYKPEGRRSVNDARGQLLAEMLAAQTLNENENPIYGCYMNGRLWFFATLIGNKYCFSNGYVADERLGIVRIFNCLRKLKQILDAAAV
jgi:hypothetical protein